MCFFHLDVPLCLALSLPLSLKSVGESPQGRIKKQKKQVTQREGGHSGTRSGAPGAMRQQHGREVLTPLLVLRREPVASLLHVSPGTTAAGREDFHGQVQGGGHRSCREHQHLTGPRTLPCELYSHPRSAGGRRRSSAIHRGRGGTGGSYGGLSPP